MKKEVSKRIKNITFKDMITPETISSHIKEELKNPTFRKYYYSIYIPIRKWSHTAQLNLIKQIY